MLSPNNVTLPINWPVQPQIFRILDQLKSISACPSPFPSNLTALAADLHLADIMLYGPFDFKSRRQSTPPGPRNKVSKGSHFIANVYRKQAEDAAQRLQDVRQLLT